MFDAVATGAYFRGLAALRSAHPADAGRWLRTLEEMSTHPGATDVESLKVVAVHRLQLAAAIEAARPGGGTTASERALSLLAEAAALEDKLPISGPVFGIPTRELEGEILLEARRPAEARAAFAAVLERYPNRPRALFRMALAARQAGDKAAAREACRQLAADWRQADIHWPALEVARSCAR